MAGEKKVNIKKERERFLTDPVLSALDDQLVRIHMTAMPVYVISDNEIIERKYNPKTRALVENIEKKRREYIKAEYGISGGDRKWQEKDRIK